jgi:hypothetical protein
MFAPLTWFFSPIGRWLSAAAGAAAFVFAFYWKGRYHLHYIYGHNGVNFAHLSSKDLVHWKWHPTTLTPKFTGHGMFSGTGFITKDGRPAIIYHGEGSGRNQLAFALSWSGKYL